MRATKSAVKAVRDSVAIGLEKYSVLIGAIRDAKVARQAVRFGARILGNVPSLFDGETATIAYITTQIVRAPRRGDNSPEVSNGCS
jgi:hypothetical protein